MPSLKDTSHIVSRLLQKTFDFTVSQSASLTISGVLTANLSKTVANLLASIKLQAYSPPLPIETDRIHVSNGTYFIDGSFTVVKSYCNTD